MEIYVENAHTKKKMLKMLLRLLHVRALPLARSLCGTTCVLYLVGHMLPGPLHLLLLAVARMRVVPQTGLVLHQLHEFHIENGIILACHARKFSNTVQCGQLERWQETTSTSHTHTRTQARTRTVNLRALRPFSKNNKEALFYCCLCVRFFFLSHLFLQWHSNNLSQRKRREN